MKRNFLLLLILALFTFSCKKTEITPQPDLTNSPQLKIPTEFNNLASYVSSGVINIDGAHDITISGKSINGGSAPAITLTNCHDVHITQNSLGNSSDVGIYLYNCYNITVDYNFITNVSTGVYVDHPSGGGTVINNNQMLNMKGPFPRGQFVQFNTVKGAGNQISYNKLQNILGQSSSQEAINLYMCNGTPDSPIQVVGNWIRGGGPGDASGGIQLGDTGGSYEVASDNILVDPGQMGLSISGGDHISFINNTVYSQAQYFSNVGIVVWGQAGANVTNATVSGNKVNFKSASGAQNDTWIAGGNPTPAGWNTNTWKASIDGSILPTNLISSTATSAPLAPVTAAISAPVTSVTQSIAGGTSSAPIVMSGRNGVTISNLNITGGTQPCIKLTNCSNVYITLCTLQNSSDVAIDLSNCTNVTIEKNNISNVAAGIIARNCPNGGISIYTNQVKNMQGSLYGGSFVQFVSVNGSNNNISYNKFQNTLGQSNTRHAIDIVSSYGNASDPIMLNGNWIRGGGPDNSGGGICLGDNGGAYQVATNNILADPGQFGLAIVGGNNNSLTNNTVYSKQQSFSNVGIYVWTQSGPKIYNCTVSGNRVSFKNSSNVQNDRWLASGEWTPGGWDTNNWSAQIDESVLPSNIISF